MAFVYANPNPHRERVGDCTVRAISLATGKPYGGSISMILATTGISQAGLALCVQ